MSFIENWEQNNFLDPNRRDEDGNYHNPNRFDEDGKYRDPNTYYDSDGDSCEFEDRDLSEKIGIDGDEVVEWMSKKYGWADESDNKKK